MAQLTTTTAYLDPLTQQPFNGLLYVRQWNNFVYGSCLVVQLDNGLITNAYSYAGGPTSSNLVALTLPVDLPATGAGEAYAIGFQAGATADLLANLPVSNCYQRTQTLITMPDQATIEISALEANVFEAEPTVASLQAQITALQLAVTQATLTANATCDDQLAAAQATADAALAASQAETVAAQAQVTELTTANTTLQAQVDALTPTDEATAQTTALTAINTAAECVELCTTTFDVPASSPITFSRAGNPDSVSNAISGSGGGNSGRARFVPASSIKASIRSSKPCNNKPEDTIAKIDGLMAKASAKVESANLGNSGLVAPDDDQFNTDSFCGS